MCDTVAAFRRGDNRSFFGKNSDREPGELQFVYLSINPVDEFNLLPFIEEKEEYLSHSFQTLKNIFSSFDNRYSAIISRPIWMWGAEMGVNEFGLSIGNEAVFSNEKVNRDGLLGMDILRLALHNTKTARDAVRFITKLINDYGQGGDGGYTRKMKYHNSFIIKDFSEGYVLETSGNHFAFKRIDENYSISNSYTLGYDYEKTDNSGVYNFKGKYEKSLYSFFSKGDARQNCTLGLIREANELEDIMKTLRTHDEKSEEPKGGMKSVCMHPGKLIKSETTSSMIVDYIGDKLIVWMTASPNPCISLYKPRVFSRENGFNDIGSAVNYAKELTSISKKLTSNHELFKSKVKPLRDEMELKFQDIIYRDIDFKSLEDLAGDTKRCMEFEREYIESVKKL